VARTFNGSSDKLKLSGGGSAGLAAAISVAVVVKLNASRDTAWRSLYASLNTFSLWNNGYVFELDNANRAIFSDNSGHSSNVGTTTTTSSDGWVLLAVSKPAGSSTVRFHRYKYSTNAFVHENMSGTCTDATGNAAVYVELFGDLGGSGDWFGGDAAIAAAWGRALSDAEIESLPFTLQSWYASAPAGLWLLDQAATSQKVADLTGNGADESVLTGTSIASSSVPVFNYTDGVWIPTHPAAGGGGGSSATVDGIASGEAFGSDLLNVQALTAAIASAEAAGLPTASLQALVSAIASAEAAGVPSATVQAVVSGILSGSAFGSDLLNLQALVLGIASGQAFGTDSLSLQALVPSIGSGEAFGLPTVSQAGQAAVSGIASAEAFGADILNLQALVTGIVSSAAFGAEVLSVQALLIGIPSSEAFGLPTVNAEAPGEVSRPWSALTVAAPSLRRVVTLH
jgi:hypothetical protein